MDSISREVSIFNIGEPSAPLEAISREVSLFNIGQPAALLDAISREVSVFNQGEPSASLEAVSREVSVINLGGAAQSYEAISREVSVFNQGEPSAPIEAISREVSVFMNTNPLPDLAVEILSAPFAALGGDSVQLVYSITNSGLLAADPPWTHKFLLSTNAEGLFAQPIATVGFTNVIPPGGSLVQTQFVALPVNAFGSLYLGVFVDAAGQIPESNETNDTAFSQILITYPPLPDLIINAISANNVVQAGQLVTVSWNISNAGPATATAPWKESLWLANNSAGSDAISLITVNTTNTLEAHGNFFNTRSAIMPAGLAGNFWLAIQVDSEDQVFEGFGETNNSFVGPQPISIQSPDLSVSLVTSPATAIYGQPFVVSWMVTNSGSGPASANWSDRVWLSSVSNSISGATLLATVAADVSPFASTASYATNAQVTIPLSAQSQAGSFWLSVQTDATGAQPESSENNNLRSLPLTLTLPPLPDLTAGQLSAPVSSLPGDLITLKYAVTNVGPAAISNTSWRETVYLLPDTGLSGTNVESFLGSGVAVASFLTTNTVSAGGFLSRTQSLIVPANSPLGNARFVIAMDSGNSITEANETNNLALATNVTVIPAMLTLQLPTMELLEGNSMTGTVFRNGGTAEPLTVTLTNDDPTEISFSLSATTSVATVTIPAGSSSAQCMVRALNDGVVDGAQLVNLFASASNFPIAAVTVTALDLQVPGLTLVLSTNWVAEGDTLRATVVRDFVTANPVTVYFESSSSTRLQVPASVTIPGGSNSWTFSLTAVNDSTIRLPANVTVTASASGFTEGSTALTIWDNDTPAIALSLQHTNVSEGAGPQAVVGIVTRTPIGVVDTVIGLQSSDVSRALVPTAITIPAGQASASFLVAAVDNNTADGPHPVNITPSVLTSANGSVVTSGAPVLLTLLDDDGPTLKLAIAMKLVSEGQNPATTATVTRNTPATKALFVALSSSNTNEASVPAAVTIPVGQASASFNITTVNDDITDGTKTITLTASAAGFISGADSLVVSDVNLPDLVVSEVGGLASVDTEAYFNVSYRVVNQGVIPCGSNFLTRIFLSSDPVVGNDVLLGQYTFIGSLPPGQSFAQTLQVLAPAVAGKYWIVAATDVGDAVGEVLEDNNTTVSSAPVMVSAAYGATIQADLHSAVAGTPIPMHGHATNSLGASAPFRLVSIHVGLRGTLRKISALTDANGNFATTWQPLQNEAGHYSLGADYPGATTTAVQDEFTLYGFKAESASLSLSVADKSSVSGMITLKNQSEVPLTGMTASVLSKPANLTVTANLGTNVIAGDAQIALGYAITANDASSAGGTVVVRIASAESASVDIPITVTVQPLRPVLVSYPNTLYAGMVRGKQAILEFDVVNEGGAASGPITISLPNAPWLSLASTNPMPSLAVGQTNHVTLQLKPASDLPLGPYTGSLALNVASANLSLPFEFRSLSESRGGLVIKTVDDYTFFAEGHPPVTNALVRITDSLTHALVASGSVDGSGSFSVPQLLEGYYEVQTTAGKHADFRATLLVRAGITNKLEAFLPAQTVFYSWSVKPVTVEDSYSVTLTTTFETAVPAPVVTVNPADVDLAYLHQTGQRTQINLTIANHGLIAALDAKLALPSHPYYQFTAAVTDLGTLPPMSSITVPVVVERRSPTNLTGASDVSMRGEGEVTDLPCAVQIALLWGEICGPRDWQHADPINFRNLLDDCPSLSFPPQKIVNLTTVDSVGSRNSPLRTIIELPPQVETTPGSCDPCLANFLLCTLLNCAPIPGKDCYDAVTGCSDAYRKSKLLTSDGLQCVNNGLSCALWLGGKAVNPAFSCLMAAGFCALEYRNCELAKSRARPDPFTPAARADPVDLLDFEADRFVRTLAPVRYFFGDDKWLAAGNDPAFVTWMQTLEDSIESASELGVELSTNEIQALLSLPAPSPTTSAEVQAFIARWLRTADYYKHGWIDDTNLPAGYDTNFIALNQFEHCVEEASEVGQEYTTEGFVSSNEALTLAKERVKLALAGEASPGICARVRIKLEQEAVIARDAFQASLELENNESSPLSGVRVDLRVHSTVGEDAGSLFAVNLAGVQGMTSPTGGGLLSANSTGKADWLIVPSSTAAPSNDTVYTVGGTLRYEVNGLAVTVTLADVPITVKPSPRLALLYFHQRDVSSDDPFTEVIEPSIPFNLAVMAQNHGYGLAKNFHITSAQPQIVDNEKGLLIDFRIIGTEVAGQNLLPSLTANFGDINPGQIAIGRWLMTSTLQGLFTDYKATFQHTDELGGTKTSLIDDVSIHEMIHLVQAPGAFGDGKPDFLVNDIPDGIYDLPDTLYLSDGSTNAVAVVTNGTLIGAVSASSLVVTQTAVMPPGWTYLRLPDPGNGQFMLKKAVRSDGVEVYFGTNVWTTDRTFIGLGLPPIRENILHLLDYNSAGSYVLYYSAAPPPDTNAPTSSVAALSPESYPSFTVNWSGDDNSGGSGLAFFDIYASDNGGPFLPWLQHTGLRSAVYPGVFGHSYAFYSRATDLSGNIEAAPSVPQASTVVTKTNSAPMFGALNPVLLDEGQTLSLDLPASDPDNDSLNFTFLGSAPVGMSLNAVNGHITWPTSEATGPSTNVISIRVSDSGVPSLSLTGVVTIVVNEINSPPILAVITNRTISEGFLLTITNAAQDFDLPAQELTFSLGPGAPTNASIHKTTGRFTWRPTELQGGTTNRIAVIVSDDGVPSASDTQSFTVVVRDTQPDFTLSLGTTQLLAGAAGRIPLRLHSGTDLTNVQLVLAVHSDRLTNLNLQALAPEVAAADFQALGSNRFNATFRSRSDAALQGDLPLAQLAFATVTNGPSSVARLTGESLRGDRASSAVPLSGGTAEGRVFVIAREPILDATVTTNRQLALDLYALPGKRYALLKQSSLEITNGWRLVEVLSPNNLKSGATQLPADAPMEMFRMYELPPSDLNLRLESGAAVIEWPQDCAGCQLEETDTLGSNVVWQRSLVSPQLVGEHYQAQLPAGVFRRYYRLSVPLP